MRLFRPFPLLRLVYPGAIFRITTKDKLLCLTFDDGPNPDSTPRILEILCTCNVNAIFFCSGRAAEEYPELVALIALKGHIIGNHGYSHLSGWKTTVRDYVKNAVRADIPTSSDLFRPPYGRIGPVLYRELIKKYKVVFWDLMPYDYDKRMIGKEVLKILKKKIRPGSVISLHDKPSSSVLSFLTDFIKYAEDEGYRFVIPPLSGKK